MSSFNTIEGYRCCAAFLGHSECTTNYDRLLGVCICRWTRRMWSLVIAATNRTYVSMFTVNAAKHGNIKQLPFPAMSLEHGRITMALDSYILCFGAGRQLYRSSRYVDHFEFNARQLQQPTSLRHYWQRLISDRRHRPPRHASPNRRAKSEYHAALRSGVGDVSEILPDRSKRRLLLNRRQSQQRLITAAILGYSRAHNSTATPTMACYSDT